MVNKRQVRRGACLRFSGKAAKVKGMSERISIKPNVCNGRPVVRGTRITVQTVLEFLDAGDSVEDVLEEYPKLTRADVQACLNYASGLLGLRPWSAGGRGEFHPR